MSLVIMVRTRLTTGGIAEPVVADTAKSLTKLGHRVILLAWDRTGKFETTTTTEWGTIWRYQEKCALNKPLVFARKLPGFLWWSTWQILAFHKLERDIILLSALRQTLRAIWNWAFITLPPGSTKDVSSERDLFAVSISVSSFIIASSDNLGRLFESFSSVIANWVPRLKSSF